jgi:hypothetical protein
VDVTLIEFAIQPVAAKVPAGAVAFAATNEGSEPHALVIARWDGDPADLPTEDDGGVDESQLPDDAVICEIEEFAGGQSCDGTLELDDGNYVLFSTSSKMRKAARSWPTTARAWPRRDMMPTSRPAAATGRRL